MPPKAGYWTPMLHVQDVARSIQFYELLGFELIDSDGGPASIGWARLHCEGAAIMLFLAEDQHPLDTSRCYPSYMYTPDLHGLREQLLAHGVNVSQINHPPYMQSGEITVKDPDGYVIFIGHWGDAEHSAWLARIEEKKRAGTLRPAATGRGQ